MRKQKNKRRFAHGGPREGAGRPEGRTKTKVCVSIDTEVLTKATDSLTRPFSNLVEMLLDRYTTNTINSKEPVL
jgi:hypothetical protein